MNTIDTTLGVRWGARLTGWLPLGAVAAVAAAVLVYYGDLRHPGLVTGDEALTALRSVGLLRHGHGWTPYWNGEPDMHKPPLYYWLVAACYGVFGVGELAVRLPSVVSLILLLFVTYRFVTRAERSAWTGVVAAVLVAVHPLLLTQSRVGMLDTTMCLFIAVALAALEKAETRPHAYLVWGASTAMALLTKAEGASFVVPIAGLYIIAMQRGAFRSRYFYMGAGLVAMIAGGWFVSEFLLHRQLFLRPHYSDFVDYRLKHSIWASFLSQKTTRGLWASWGALAPLMTGAPLLLLPWGEAKLAGATGEARRRRRVLVLCVLWVVVPMLMISLVRQQMYWYSLPAVVPMACLAAILLSRLVRGGLRPWASCGVALLLAAGTGLSYAFLPGRHHGWIQWGIATSSAVIVLATVLPPAWGARRWRAFVVSVAVATAILLVVVGGLAPSNHDVDAARYYDAEPYRRLAALVPARAPDAPPIIVNFRNYPQNCFMFYAGRDTVQLRSFSYSTVAPGAERDAVIEDCDYAPFLAGLEVTVIARQEPYTVMTVRNTSGVPVRPAAVARRAAESRR